MSVPPIARGGTERGNMRTDARCGIVSVVRAFACEGAGPYPPHPLYLPLPYSTPGMVADAPTAFFLYREEGERGERKRITLENKAKARTPRGGTQGGTGEERRRLRLGVLPSCHPCRPNNPRACEARPVTSRRLASVRCSIRSLRAEPALSGPRRAFLSDIGPLARSVARSTSAPGLFGAHNRASFGCDNASSRQPVRSGGSVGDGGGRGKKRSVPGGPTPLGARRQPQQRGGRCTNP